MMEYSTSIISQVVSNNVLRVLIDETAVLIELSTLDQLELMNYFVTNIPKSLDIKFCVVFSETNRETVDFFESLSQKVGFDCTFYPSKKEALINLLATNVILYS